MLLNLLNCFYAIFWIGIATICDGVEANFGYALHFGKIQQS